MLTLPDLTAGPVPVLRRPEPAAEATAQQQLDDVVVCDARWRLPPEDAPRVRAGLAVLPTGPEGAGPEDAGAALRQLARAGVVAVVPAPATAPARELLEQADRAGLPVLLPAGPWDAHETLRRVLRRQLAVEREYAQASARVLTLSACAPEQADGPARLVRAVAAVTGGPVVLAEPGGAEWVRLAAVQPRALEQVRSGRARTAFVPYDDGRELVLHAVGRDRPHRVLAAVLPGGGPAHLRQLLAHTAGQLTLLDAALRSRRDREVLRTALRGIRVSVLQYLMLGNWEGAVRVAEPLAGLGAAEAGVGEVLAAGRGVVAVLQCAPGEDRTGAAYACEEAVGGGGLVVPCPADPRHVIVVLPQDPDGTAPLAVLRPVVGQAPGRFAGVSGPRPWSQTASAYGAAVRALTAAERDPLPGGAGLVPSGLRRAAEADGGAARPGRTDRPPGPVVRGAQGRPAARRRPHHRQQAAPAGPGGDGAGPPTGHAPRGGGPGLPARRPAGAGGRRGKRRWTEVAAAGGAGRGVGDP
ncbi:hypothetical protein ACSLFT_17965 [Streptomyces sp. G6]|uniref:hypothetical protein n=1 Tax=Streptomyces sp. G6 TaxID=1178736 RepID=UPI003EDB4FE6